MESEQVSFVFLKSKQERFSQILVASAVVIGVS